MKKTVLKENNSCRMQCIAEENLEQEMDSQVEPFLKQVQICGWMEVAPEGGESQERDVASADSTSQKSENAPEDGVAQRKTVKTGGLYYELYPQETQKGTIVISYGFTESCLKYHELIYYFYLQGYQVAIMDHRGHGKSMREVEDHTIVHIGLFSRYVKDLHRFVKTVVKPMAKDLPLYLYAHSMGGCIGAFYLEQYPEDFAKAVLNAPMFGVNLGGVPSWAARVLCDFKVFGGNGKDRLLTQGTFDPEESFSDASCSSEARHDYYMKKRREDESCQTSSGSYEWGREAINAGKFVISKKQAKKVKTPVLLFQAGKDTLVTPGAQKEFIKRIPDGQLVVVPDIRHEIYRAPNSVLQPYLEMIFEFYDSGEKAL